MTTLSLIKYRDEGPDYVWFWVRSDNNTCFGPVFEDEIGARQWLKSIWTMLTDERL